LEKRASSIRSYPGDPVLIPVLFLMILFFFPTDVFSQRDIVDEGPLPDSLLQFQQPVEPDSLELSTFFLEDIHRLSGFRDSLLDYRFLHYNPVFEQDMPYLFLGNNGSAAIPVIQLFERKGGFDLGVHSYDIYRMSIDSFRWYRTNLPYSDLFFSGGPTENDFRVAAKYAMNFANDWSINLDYERIIETGYYQNQQTKQSSISLGMMQGSWNTRSQTFLVYIGNIHQEQSNGGIRDTLLLASPSYQIRRLIPVNLSNAVGRLQDNRFSVINHYRLGGIQDSAKTQINWPVELVSELNYENGFFKYTDEQTSTVFDSAYYGKLLVDPIGIRHYITYDKFGLSPAIQSVLPWNSRVRLGLAYDWWIIEQEPIPSINRHDVRLTGRIDSRPAGWFGFDGKAEYHLGAYQGDFTLEAGGFFNIGRLATLEGKQSLRSSHPSLIEQGFSITSSTLQENRFNQVFSSQSRLALHLHPINFSIRANWHTISQYIYFDPDFFFRQLDGSFSILDIRVDQHFQLAGFHLDLKGHWFWENSTVLDLPDYHLYGRLYYKGPVLGNKLALNTGVELHWLEGFQVPGYQAVVGQFHARSGYISNPYLMLNGYLGVKIGNFRLFVRTENILNAITGEANFHVFPYPLNDFRPFRIGIRWQFVN
jgi:hypothetical protein